MAFRFPPIIWEISIMVLSKSAGMEKVRIWRMNILHICSTHGNLANGILHQRKHYKASIGETINLL